MRIGPFIPCLGQASHFLAIAWMYRADYCRAGLCRLDSVDPVGSVIGRHMICYCHALVAASLTPLVIRGARPVCLAGVLLLGLASWDARLALPGGVGWRGLALSPGRASLICLPALLRLLFLDGLPY
jgi:heme O synthase-like polyprenyltransferase